jgi:hypothetical protein
VLGNLRKAGVQNQMRAQRLQFDTLEPWAGQWINAREEAELLMYHGYWSTHVRLRHLRPDLTAPTPRWRQYADLSDRAAANLLAVLAAGESRSLRRR